MSQEYLFSLASHTVTVTSKKIKNIRNHKYNYNNNHNHKHSSYTKPNYKHVPNHKI